MRYTDKVCLITGAGSGIGRATAQRMASEGGKGVVIDLNPEVGKETVKLIKDAGDEAVFAACNVSNEEQILAAVKGAVDTPMLWNNPNVKSGAEKVKGEIGQPEEPAAAIAFLASDDASFINGITLIVDGGRLDVL